MDFLFSTGSLWTHSIRRCFEFAAQAGFDGIELMVDQRWDTRQADFLIALIKRIGLPIVAMHSPFMANIPGWPEDQPSRINKTVQLAETVGARVVVHHLPGRIGYLTALLPGRIYRIPIPTRPQLGYRDWLNTDYESFQSKTSIKLCIENMPAYRRFGRRWNYSYWNTAEEIIRFPNLTMDTTHLGTWGLEPADIYPRLNGRVAHIHLSNFDGVEHLRPEKGILQLDKLMGLLLEGNYQGAVTLELHPAALNAGEADETIIANMATSLKIVRQWAGLPA